MQTMFNSTEESVASNYGLHKHMIVCCCKDSYKSTSNDD